MGKTTKIVLTASQQEWLEKHFKHTRNDEISARFGWSLSSLHRFARQLGLKKSPQFMSKMQRNAADKANASHIKNGTYPPKGYIIPGSEKHRFEKGVTPLQRLGKKKNEQRKEKSRASRAATLKMEKARAMFGLAQRTKMKVISQPKKAILQRYYLKRLGYIIERGSMTAYYDENTRRSEDYENRTRANCKNYIGFTFKPYDSKA